MLLFKRGWKNRFPIFYPVQVSFLRGGLKPQEFRRSFQILHARLKLTNEPSFPPKAGENLWHFPDTKVQTWR